MRLQPTTILLAIFSALSAVNCYASKPTAMWVSTDHYHSPTATMEAIASMDIVAWRGERASAQLLVYTAEEALNMECSVGKFRSKRATLPATIAELRIVRHTIAAAPNSDATTLVGDLLENGNCFSTTQEHTQPLWLTISVPQDAEPGIYTSEVVITFNGKGKIRLPLTLEVQPYTLATPDKWSYHLDLWQHPTAVARAEGLELWSDAHFEALKRDMTPLANAGQKVITATLNKDPWNHQCYDGYEAMIRWTRHADDSWSYDYTIFDRWVELMFSLGIDKMINCYSMVPWNCELEYYDEATDALITVVAEPGTEVFTAMWRPFLVDFKAHLEAKGWLSKTNIAMDERSPEAMDAAVDLLAECAPEMGFAIADMHQSYKRYLNMRDVCVAQEQPADHADILSRRAEGFTTTFYICCNPAFPNTFTTSQPFEAELLGWYGLALDYDGMLRWAYNSWPADPACDSRYGNWTSGDTFLVYPYARSSVRFERLIDGIEVAEKVRTLRAMGVDISEVEAALEAIRTADINDPTQPWIEILTDAREALNRASSESREQR